MNRRREAFSSAPVTGITAPMSTIETDLLVAENEAFLTLAGTVDVSNAHRLGSLLRRLIDDGCTCVTIDLHQVSQIDAAGVGILRGTARTLARRAGELAFRNPTANVARSLGEAGLRPTEATA